MVALIAGIVLLIVLGWAAAERGRIHRRRAQLRRRVRTGRAAARVLDWCMAAGWV